LLLFRKQIDTIRPWEGQLVDELICVDRGRPR